MVFFINAFMFKYINMGQGGSHQDFTLLKTRAKVNPQEGK
jgi:hypothetical protein